MQHSKTSPFKISYLIFLSVISLYSLLFAGAPDTLWTRTYGGALEDRGYSVQQTNDGGFIIVGTTKSFGAGEADVYLIRTNSGGDTLWTRTYGGVDNDFARSVQQTSDGGFVISGWTSNFGAAGTDVYLIKINSIGDTVWTKTYDRAANDYGYSVQQLSDEGFIVSGFTSAEDDVYLIRTDHNGDTLWTKTYGESYREFGRSVQVTNDGGFIIAGSTSSISALDSIDVYIVRTNSNGDTLWTKTFGGDSSESGHSIQQTNDSGFIIAGSKIDTMFFIGDVYVIRTNSNGDTLWTKTYGGTYSEGGYSVQQTSDGGFIIAGFTYSFGAGSEDVYVIRTNSSGDTVWTRTYGGTGHDYGNSVQQTKDGGFVIAGHKESFGAGNYDVYLIRLDKDSTGIQEDNFNNFLNPNDFIVSYNNNLISIRYTIQYSSYINLSMYNISGQLVKTLFNEYKSAGDYFINFNTSNISAGVYYFKLTAGKSSYTQKAVVVR